MTASQFIKFCDVETNRREVVKTKGIQCDECGKFVPGNYMILQWEALTGLPLEAEFCSQECLEKWLEKRKKVAKNV